MSRFAFERFAMDSTPQEDLDRLTKLYHETREKWKDAHGEERDKLAGQVSYIQQQMYSANERLKRQQGQK